MFTTEIIPLKLTHFSLNYSVTILILTSLNQYFKVSPYDFNIIYLFISKTIV